MKQSAIKLITIGLFSIPGGILVSWFGATGIRIGDYIYTYPYLTILGVVMVLLGIFNMFRGLVFLGRRTTP